MQTNFFFLLAKSLLALAIVLGVIYIFYRYVLVHFSPRSGTAKPTLKIKERLYLSPQASLFIVEGPKKSWLVGISGQQITLIDRLAPEDLG